MFTIIGCLGTVIAGADTVEQAISTVQGQVTLTPKKLKAMRNALERLRTGQEYHVEYGGSGCTVRCL